MNIIKQNIKTILIAILISLVVTLIVYFIRAGFHTESVYEIDITQSGRAWITANFSETTLSIDMDGDPYLDTDYWSVEASDTWNFRTVNGIMIENGLNMPSRNLKQTGPKLNIIRGYPVPYSGIQARRHFDNFSNRNNYSYRMAFAYKKDGKLHHDDYGVSKSLYNKIATLDLNKTVNLSIDMWYNSVNGIKIIQ